MLADARATRQRLRVSLALTAGIVAIEVGGGMYANSISLVSDAAHVLTDAMSIALSLFALNLAARSHAGIMTYGLIEQKYWQPLQTE